MSNITTEEKIDYIYNHIKTEKKFLYGRRVFKILMYVCIIGYMYYFVMFGFNNLIDRVVESVKPNISAESLVDGVKNSGTNLLNSDTINNLKQKYLNSEKNADGISDNELLENNNNY